jgi:hypothetical protein
MNTTLKKTIDFFDLDEDQQELILTRRNEESVKNRFDLGLKVVLKTDECDAPNQYVTVDRYGKRELIALDLETRFETLIKVLE